MKNYYINKIAEKLSSFISGEIYKFEKKNRNQCVVKKNSGYDQTPRQNKSDVNSQIYYRQISDFALGMLIGINKYHRPGLSCVPINQINREL